MREKFRIGYIDDDPAEIRRFKRFARNDFDVVTYELNENTTLESLFREVLESGVSALVIDYDLKDKEFVRFNGEEIVDKINEELHNFPLIIFTAYEDEALDAVEDPNIVYEKEGMGDEKQTLLKRIRIKIDSYRKNLDESEEELLKLTEKSDREGLSAWEEDRMIELDNFLEKSVSKRDKIPSAWKRPGGLEKLNELVRKTDELFPFPPARFGLVNPNPPDLPIRLEQKRKFPFPPARFGLVNPNPPDLAIQREQKGAKMMKLPFAIHNSPFILMPIISTEIAAGVIPSTRDACPREAGLISESFSMSSFESPCTLA